MSNQSPRSGSNPIPPKAKDAQRQLTVKQQREQRRAEKVAEFQRAQARQRRNRMITIVSSIVGGVGVLALVITLVIVNAAPKVDPASIAIDGLQSYPNLTANHVQGSVTYDQTPPVGGDHASIWLNCGVYSEPVPNENAVHDLEHGAVWVTYDPDAVDAAGVDTLRAALPSTYIVLSPYPGLGAPVVASAWGEQVKLDGVDDPRLGEFITKFWRSNDAPEPGAACTGGLDGPGRVA